ncbi:hypothetical protein [Streptomyces sp. PvR034]|uniref:hypothetical protein n=1 Tax=Streptomyces sp. PvR034 TaxID=3156401 RepID=UPI00339958D7
MDSFHINKGRSGGRHTVVADHFETVGEFVDFFEGATVTSAVVFRIRAAEVHTIERGD